MKQLPSAKKHLGQHFLRDQKVISGISQDWSDEADVIIEVGPGPGILTQYLCKYNKPFFVIEKDSTMQNYLSPLLEKDHIFFEDALKFNWPDFLTKNNLLDKKIWLVSNLPYNVGTILYINFLQIPQIHYMTLMFQKEVGDKTYMKPDNKPKSNQMNGLLFLSLNYLSSRKLFKVPPGSFSPPPKVDSVVVSYERKVDIEISIADFPKINQFCRQIFSQKRKQLGSVLKQYYPSDKLSEALLKCDISPQVRAETLSFQQVKELFTLLVSYLK